MEVYRVCARAYAANPLDGEGSFLYGARWSSPKTHVAYTSTTPELARLEHALHLPYTRVAIPLAFAVAEVPDDLIEHVKEAELPEDWDAVPASAATRLLGDAWIRSTRSLGLAVPSTLIPLELTQQRNVLINPQHPAAGSLKVTLIPFIHKPRPDGVNTEPGI